MSRSVTVITAREVYRYKMAYHGDKFLHIGAVTIVNNTDHTPHYAIEEEFQSRTFLMLRLHYVPGGHGGHVSDNREQNGITVRQRKGTG